MAESVDASGESVSVSALRPDHGSRYRRIKGQCSHDGVALVVGKPGNGLYFLMVEVRLVDEDRDRDAEVVAQAATRSKS